MLICPLCAFRFSLYTVDMPHHHIKHRNWEPWVIAIILVVAFVFRFQHIATAPPGLYPDEAMNGNNALEAIATGDYKVFYPDNNGREGLFMNIQAQSIKLFSNTPWALRIVSALFGLLTVLGLYKLAKLLFNWEIAAFASFFMAISTWHVIFSRIGFRAIMAPFFLVWGFYFFWKGLRSSRMWDFAISGIFWGLGFYSYISFRVMPLALLFALWAYWYSVKKDFSHEKYEHTKIQLIRGFAMLMVVAILVVLPLGIYFYTHSGDLIGRTGQLSIFSSENPIASFAINVGKTFGSFNVIGDYNWRHNISGAPLLFWPIGLFFVIGFFRSLHKLVKTRRTHGHYSSVQVMLLSWFFIGLLPVVLSNEGIPHALRAIVIIPPVMIFAGEGLWWLYDFIKKERRDFVAGFAVIIFLFALMLNSYHAYFTTWAKNPEVANAFSSSYVELGNKLNTLPNNEKKYVVVNAGGELVRGIPMSAQTVMYITDTWTPEKQKAKNLYYLTEEQYNAGKYDRKASIFFLE